MKELNGLWKNQRCGLLVQLHGAEISASKSFFNALEGLATLKAVVRLVEGDEEKMNRHVRLTAVLPKQPVIVYILDASQRGPMLWDVTGVVRSAVKEDEDVFTGGRAG